MISDPAIARAAARWRVKNAVSVILLALILIGGSGNPRWTAGWLYVVLILVQQIVLYVVPVRSSPELMVERSRMQPGTKTWDKVIVSLMAMILPLAMWVVAALDARYAWSPLAAGWQVPGFLLAIIGITVVIAAMRTNRFFSATVRIQRERGHTVVDSGPYAYVRHPGYIGAIAFTLGTPLALGSAYAFVPALLCAALTILRTALEDRTLRAELEGYAEYSRRVRARLIPAVW
jgi:protein-S-isoprenylcysteine O-methyltransferase Ste14